MLNVDPKEKAEIEDAINEVFESYKEKMRKPLLIKYLYKNRPIIYSEGVVFTRTLTQEQPLLCNQCDDTTGKH